MPVNRLRLNQTDAIDWVAAHMHGVDNLLIGGTQFVWRSGSAAAHAQLHFGLQCMDRDVFVDNDSGRRFLQLRGSVEDDVGPAMGATVLTLSEAFRLYDLRRVAHV